MGYSEKQNFLKLMRMDNVTANSVNRFNLADTSPVGLLAQLSFTEFIRLTEELRNTPVQIAQTFQNHSCSGLSATQ